MSSHHASEEVSGTTFHQHNSSQITMSHDGVWVVAGVVSRASSVRRDDVSESPLEIARDINLLFFPPT